MRVTETADNIEFRDYFPIQLYKSIDIVYLAGFQIFTVLFDIIIFIPIELNAAYSLQIIEWGINIRQTQSLYIGCGIFTN